MKRENTGSSDGTKRRLGRCTQGVVDTIRRRIASGVYPPHSFLPSERELTEDLGVSRTSIRTAIATVVRDGLVVRSHGRGVSVIPPLSHSPRTAIGVFYRSPATTPYQEARIYEEAHILEGVRKRLTHFGQAFELISLAAAAYESRDTVVDAEHAGGEPADLSPEEIARRYGAAIWIEALDHENLILDLEKKRFPLVVANLEVDIDVSATFTDHGKATRSAVEIMVKFGHREIALLTRQSSYLFYAAVEEGYREALDGAGIAYDPAMVAVCERTQALDAYLETRELLKKTTPTAIVAARDILAHGACRAIVETGRVVGHDISVIGFDDYSWPENERFLTTFSEPCLRMGTEAVNMVMDRVVNGWKPPKKKEINAPLILRRSAGPILIHGEAPSGEFGQASIASHTAGTAGECNSTPLGTR